MNNIALIARGPQDEYVIDNTLPVYPEITQYTDFSIDQKTVQFGNPPFIGRLHRIDINPRTIDGDVISNMHISISLPKLATGSTYCDNIGRNLIRTCRFYVDDTVIEETFPEWFVIHDDIFLDDDEKMALSNVINEGYSTSKDDFKLNYTDNPHMVDVIIPLEFFFCRRHSPYKSYRERSSKPFFPLCAVWRQNVYIEIEFQPQTFFTNSSDMIDFVKTPELIIETCKLTPEERYGIMERPQKFIITQVYREPVTDLVNNTDGKFKFTAKFPVSLTTWFFRKKVYENANDSQYFDNRFQFGYSYTENNQLKTLDPFQFIRLFINNQDSTPEIGGISFFKHIQALNYNMSTPNNEIYIYSFGKYPKEYRIDTTFNFKDASAFIQFSLDDKIALDVRENYTFNVYHFGYAEVMISNGRLLRVG